MDISLERDTATASLDSNKDEESSRRVKAFDNAIEGYINSIFGYQFFANTLTRSLKPLYRANKETFQSRAKEVEKKLHGEMTLFVQEEVEKLNIKDNLTKLDKLEDETNKENMSLKISGSNPEQLIKAHLYAVKCKYLEKHQKTINADELKNELETKLKEYNEQKSHFQKRISKDMEINEEVLQKYKEQHTVLEELTVPSMEESDLVD